MINSDGLALSLFLFIRLLIQFVIARRNDEAISSPMRNQGIAVLRSNDMVV